MSQHCKATRIFTRWGSLSAHNPSNLASAFENTSKTTGWAAFGFGVGTALAGAGEGVSLGIDTPVAVTFGSATTFFGTASFLTGGTASILTAISHSVAEQRQSLSSSGRKKISQGTGARFLLRASIPCRRERFLSAPRLLRDRTVHPTPPPSCACARATLLLASIQRWKMDSPDGYTEPREAPQPELFGAPWKGAGPQRVQVPPGNCSLHPVAIEAAAEVTKPPEPSM